MAQAVSHNLGFLGGVGWKQGFVPKPVLVEFVIFKVAVGHFSPITSVFTRVSIIPSVSFRKCSKLINSSLPHTT